MFAGAGPGARRFRALVVGLPLDSALARLLEEEAAPAPAEPAVPPIAAAAPALPGGFRPPGAPPGPRPAPLPPRTFDLEAARSFAASHGGQVIDGS